MVGVLAQKWIKNMKAERNRALVESKLKRYGINLANEASEDIEAEVKNDKDICSKEMESR